MDHLPVPEEPFEPVRCACSPEAIRRIKGIEATFFEYPVKAGISIARIKRGQLDNDLVLERVEVFFQSWLFFRLLEEVLGVEIDVDAFTTYDSSTRLWYLCTANLPAHISPRKGLQGSGLEDQIRAPLAEARLVLNQIATTPRLAPAPSQILSPELELVLWTLIQTLEFELLPDSLPRQRVLAEDGGHICSLITNRMLAMKWCPNQVDMLAHTMDVPSLYYSSLLGPERMGKDHGKCDRQECLTNKIDQSEYCINHVSMGCECAFGGLENTILTSIIEDENIPVVEVSDRGITGQTAVQVQEQRENIPYVAISHVWSDGMGNPNGNSLPMCQLRRLRSLVEELLPTKALFWCDTLCVPTKPPELRRKAIWKMRDVYEKADAVLVIDSGLVTVSSKVSAEEILMRISCCGWVRRLWTFQEKFLAKSLYVVLRDELLDVNGIHDRVMTYLKNPESGAMSGGSYSSNVALEASSFLRNRRVKRKRKGGSELTIDFASVWESVQWRATSWLSDEPVCLAVALGVDLRRLLDLPEDQGLRMRTILSAQNGLPPYMIFAPFPRMKESGWRWAPTSLMSPRALSSAKLHHMNETTKWHPDGLIVQFPGFVAPICKLVDSMPNTKTRPVIIGPSLALKNTKTGAWYCAFREFEDWISDKEFIESMTSGQVKRPAVILSCPIEALWPSETQRPQLWPGVLVDVLRQESDMLYVSFLWRISVGAMPFAGIEDAENDLAASIQPTADQEKGEHVIAATVCAIMEPHQQWCVG